ncbi:hypothetical protein CCACVL1_00843, partial [Corchorus capsularis]
VDVLHGRSAAAVAPRRFGQAGKHVLDAHVPGHGQGEPGVESAGLVARAIQARAAFLFPCGLGRTLVSGRLLDVGHGGAHEEAGMVEPHANRRAGLGRVGAQAQRDALHGHGAVSADRRGVLALAHAVEPHGFEHVRAGDGIGLHRAPSVGSVAVPEALKERERRQQRGDQAGAVAVDGQARRSRRAGQAVAQGERGQQDQHGQRVSWPASCGRVGGGGGVVHGGVPGLTLGDGRTHALQRVMRPAGGRRGDGGQFLAIHRHIAQGLGLVPGQQVGLFGGVRTCNDHGAPLHAARRMDS